MLHSVAARIGGILERSVTREAHAASASKYDDIIAAVNAEEEQEAEDDGFFTSGNTSARPLTGRARAPRKPVKGPGFLADQEELRDPLDLNATVLALAEGASRALRQ